MTKFKKSIFIFGILALIIGVALGTFIVLSLTDSLKDEAIELEFTVDDAVKVYDGEPLKANSYSLTAGNLIEGHTPVVTFTGEQTEVGVGTSGLDVKIVNARGYDVSREYDIKVNSGFLYVNNCGVTISLTAQDVTYDGANIDIADGYTVVGGTLAFGHRVSVKIRDEWFDRTGKIVAGKTLTAADVDAYIVDANGRNVTGNYTVMLMGRVNVVKRQLGISPLSEEKNYDGKPLKCTQHRIESGTLAAGHYVYAEYKAWDGGEASVTNVKDSPLEVLVNVIILDTQGDDVTANYELRSGTGYLTVNASKLTISAKSKSWEYDGGVHSLEDIKEAESTIGLAYGDTVTVQYSGSVTDVSVVANKIEKYFINGEEDSENYEVTCIDGKLEVTKAPLTVKWGTLEKEYDGKPFTSKENNLYTILSAVNDLQLEFDSDDFDELLVGTTAPCNSTYTFNDFTILGDNGDITKMFNVTVMPGNIKISRRKVSVSANNLSKKYDGNLIFTENISVNKLVEGHSLVSVNVAAPQGGYFADTQFKAQLNKISLVDNQGNDVSGYYNFINFDSTLNVTILKRDLAVSTKSDKKVYDGTPLNGGNLMYGQLAYGDTLIYTPVEMIDACEEEPNAPEFHIYNANHTDVTEFYNILDDYGKLTILKKDVTVYLPENCEIEYDKNGVQSNALLGYIRCNELDQNYFGFRINETFSGLGVKTVDFDWQPKADDIKGNYKLVQGNNKFEIIKKRETASLVISSKNYDNKPLTENDILAIASKNPISTLTYVSSNLLDKVDAGTYSAEIIYEEEFYHYTVTGKYTINPITIGIEVSDSVEDGVFTKIYDGKPFTPDVKDFSVISSLDLAVKSYIRATDLIDVKLKEQETQDGKKELVTVKQTQTFKSFEIVFANTGNSIKSSNVQFSASSFSVDVIINKRVLDISLKPISGTPSPGTDLTSLIEIKNLAENDVADLRNAFVVAQGGSTWLTPSDIKIRRGGRDVTDNYELPTEDISGIIS